MNKYEQIKKELESLSYDELKKLMWIIQEIMDKKMLEE